MYNTNCALNLIDHYPDLEGAKVLQLLITHPNTDIYATVVELCLENSLPPAQAQNTRYHLAPIKMTDEQTLKAVKQRLNKLIAIVAQDANPAKEIGYEASASCATTEIQALTQYIKETTLPTGGIKCFNDEDTKAFRRQASAIRRLLCKAEQDGHHEAVAYVKQHLAKGKIMRWEE
jgi:hypothetical protein